MFDTHAIARSLTAAGIDPDHAGAITDAVRLAAEHDAANINTGALATRGDLAALEARLVKWMVGIVLTAAGIVTAAGVTLGIAILRALASFAGGG
jgi:hypothetical protein